MNITERTDMSADNDQRRGPGRPPRVPTAIQQANLDPVVAAAAARRQAETDYLQAFLAAADSGVTQAALARAADRPDDGHSPDVRARKVFVVDVDHRRDAYKV